jgi:branched-subunit amino acid transport protein AzlD
MAYKLETLHEWKQTRKGLLTVGVLELLIAYGFASWAIDSGSLWLYLLTAIFLVGALQNLFKLIRLVVNR